MKCEEGTKDNRSSFLGSGATAHAKHGILIYPITPQEVLRVKCLPCNHKDSGLFPGIRGKKPGVVVFSALKAETGGHSESNLVGSGNQICILEAIKRDPFSG